MCHFLKKKCHFYPSSRRRESRTLRFFLGAGMSEYAPKLIFDFKGILSTFSNHISRCSGGVDFCEEGRTKKFKRGPNSNRKFNF